jgi:hypothetical protein
MKRRSFLAGAAAGGVISTLDWLGYFRSFGVPGTQKELGIASAHAQAAADPKFLIYWFQEGGWDSYCMFSPLVTANDAVGTYTAGTLNPSPSWSNQFYRPKLYGADAAHFTAKLTGNIQHGFLANDGIELMPDMAVVASHGGNTFHSGGRFDYHYGKYTNSMSAMRATNERTVMQAFCEAYGANLPLSNISWHRWLSDGELTELNYPEGTGYYEKLGPAYAHTTYGKTPADMRNRLSSLGGITAGARQARIRLFVDDLHTNFVKDKNSESVKAFDSAVKIHKQLTGGTGVVINPATMFTDTTLRAEFGVTASDEQTTATSVNGNPARSKDAPATNVQALMTYEMMTKGLSCGFWIESRQIRGFDTHRDRSSILTNKGQTDQLMNMKTNLWTPLKALVTRLKNTPYGTAGKTYWDLTTIVLASEMGRTIQGDVSSILATADSDAVKYANIMDQDCCQHWKVSSAAFLGGNVQGNRQWGKVGTSSLEGIPLMPDGSLDPAYDANTGLLKSGFTKSATSYVSDAGHVYATALQLTGLDPTGKGKNTRPPMSFIKK